MWKRDESVKKINSNKRGMDLNGSGDEGVDHRTNVGAKSPVTKIVNIGKSVMIKGQVNGNEDLTIEGRVDGKIELKQNVLTIGPNGKIEAELIANSVVVLGDVTGNVTATERIEIRDSGSVDGDLVAPRVVIAEGAHFRGSVDMQRGAVDQSESEKKPSEVKPTNDSFESKRAAPAAR